mgnify:CR=1 FL=1
MEEEFENNDSIINNFQQDIKNSQNDFKQESNDNMEEENEFEDDTFQYIANIREIAKKDFSKYISKELTPNKKLKNNFTNNLNFKYAATENYLMESAKKEENININEDISGISLLKELEEQWNNIEKQKINNKNNINNKIDESTYSNSKSNNNIDKFKYVIDMIEIKKNKFITMRQKAKKERNDDHDLEQFFLMKLKEMDKYKITDENLKKNIEIRQQEKNNENIYEQNEEVNYYENDNNNNNNEYINYNDNINNYNDNDNNIGFNFSNEDTFNKKLYLQRKENLNKSPELEDLVYETPARTNGFDKNIISLEQNNYENENEDNVNIGNISRPEKSAISEKLFGKIKNLYQELNYDENKETNMISNNDKTNSYESGVLGINNINLNVNKYEENIILRNIKNNNSEIGNINDANKSINLNFNYMNIKNQRTPNLNIQKYEQNKYSQKTVATYTPDKNLIKIKENLNLFKDKDRMTLSGLQENFDEILKNVKSHNDKNNKNNLNLFNDRFNISNEDNDEKEDLDKYFDELTKEAKSNIQKNKGISNPITKINNKKENKILQKIEENSKIINNYMDEMNQNRNKFKQRIFELNNNLNNIRNKDDINNSFQENKFYGFQNINKIKTYKRNRSGYDIFSNNNYNNF